MQRIKSLRYIIPFMVLAFVSILGGLFGYLVFPAVGFLFAFLATEEDLKKEIRTIIVGLSLFAIFLLWHFIQHDKLPYMFAIIYTFALMASIEGWRFTVYTRVNIWGLMNLVVFWIAAEYLMLLWLPFDISGWLLGTPLMVGSESADGWLIFTGMQGYSLWVLLGGLLLFKSIDKKRIFIPALLGAILIIVVPALIIPMTDAGEMYYAQGEWIGRTCIWLSVLILAYSFVKRKTKT